MVLTLAAIIGPTYDRIAQIVLVFAVLAAAWHKVISPLASLVVTLNKQFIPNVKYMGDLPKINEVLTVVRDMAKQFQKNDGSSLKDDMNDLADHAVANRAAAAEAKLAAIEAQQAVQEAKAAAVEFAHTNAAGIAELQILVGTIKERARDDRELARADRDLARDALEKIRDLMASAKRTEAADAVVADDLATVRKRADEVHEDEEPGTAADAASQSPE